MPLRIRSPFCEFKIFHEYFPPLGLNWWIDGNCWGGARWVNNPGLGLPWVVIVVGWPGEQEGIKDLRTLGERRRRVVAGGRSFKSCGLSAALVSGVEVAAPDGRTSRPSVFGRFARRIGLKGLAGESRKVGRFSVFPGQAFQTRPVLPGHEYDTLFTPFCP